MTIKPIKIFLYYYDQNYTHEISLFFDNQSLADKDFWNPLDCALNNTSFSSSTTLTIPKGLLIDTALYFRRDYGINRNYKITVCNNTLEKIVINNASFRFEEDTSCKMVDGNLPMKNIVIQFKDFSCKKMPSQKG